MNIIVNVLFKITNFTKNISNFLEYSFKKAKILSLVLIKTWKKHHKIDRPPLKSTFSLPGRKTIKTHARILNSIMFPEGHATVSKPIKPSVQKLICRKYAQYSFTLKRFMYSKASVRPFIGLEMFFVFVFMSASVSLNSVRENYRIHFKFFKNIYVLCKIRCVAFGVCSKNSSYIGIRKIISMYYKL